MLSKKLKPRKTDLILNSSWEFFLLRYALLRNNFANSKKIKLYSINPIFWCLQNKLTKIKHQMLTINLTSALKWQKYKLSNENQSGYSSMFLHTFQVLVVTRFARKSFLSWDRVSLHQWSSTYGSWPLWGHTILSTGVS